MREKENLQKDQRQQQVFISKLQGEKMEQQKELASLKRNVNKIMLSKQHVGLKSEEENTSV